MRPLVIIGILLAALGAFVLVNGGSFKHREDVLKVGDLKVSADKKESVPPWLGGVAIVVGIGMAVAGARKTS